MADFTQQTYVDDDGSATVGTPFTKAIMDNIEGGVKDAAQNSKQRAAISGRPAAAAGNKNWIWIDTDGSVTYSDGSDWRPIGAPRAIKKPVDIAMMINVNTASPGATLDGQTPGAGTTRVLLMGQTTANQNGIWIWNGAAVAMTRALDAAVIANDIPNGTIVPVSQNNSTWNTAEFYLQSGSGGSQIWTMFKQPVYLHPSNSLPTNIGAPAHGLEIAYQSTSFMTNGEVWRLKYNNLSGSSFKWEFVGGSSLYAEVVAQQSTTTTANYVALTTAGPSITLPLGGDYDVEIGGRLNNTSANAGGLMSYDIGATGAVDADSINFLEGVTNMFVNLARSRRKTGLAASAALVAKYKTLLGGTFQAEVRWMKVTPVRCG